MEALQLFQVHAQVRLGFELVERPLEFGPTGPFSGDETLEVDDHGSAWGNWSKIQRNPKTQNPNPKQIPSSKSQIPSRRQSPHLKTHVASASHWNLGIE